MIRAGIAGSLASLAWLMRPAPRRLVRAAARRQSRCSRWNPYLIFDPGFELSFAAVAAIFVLVAAAHASPRGLSVCPESACAVAVSAACGVATAPILWLRFGALPLLGVAANALAEPAIARAARASRSSRRRSPVSPAGAALRSRGRTAGSRRTSPLRPRDRGCSVRPGDGGLRRAALALLLSRPMLASVAAEGG